MLVLRLMRGGSLQRALQDPDQHEALAWHNRCAGLRSTALRLLHMHV